MRKPLGEALKRLLQPDDRFVLLPVFYAGGSASFTPTSEEVAKEYAALGLPVVAATRAEAEGLLHAMPKYKAAVVMGARDSSLRDWTIGL